MKTLTLMLLMPFFAFANTSLTETIHQQDTRFFTAFNACDLDTMGKIFSQDLEFYHDTGGVQTHQQAMENTRALCARNLGLTRTLEHSEVFPIKDFGAIQTGSHTFCHPAADKMDCGTFRFVHVWQQTNNHTWQLKRVMSFDH